MSVRTHLLLTGALGAALVPAARAAAQDTPAHRFTLEGYAAAMRFDGAAIPGNDNSPGGYGARLMFNHAEPSRALRSFFGRASAGVFATFTTGQGNLDTRTTHYGVEGEAPLFRAPLYHLLDPFVSLGAGVLRTSSQAQTATGVTTTGRFVTNDFALTPAVGTRIPLFGGIGFRGDLRLPVVFGDKTTINSVAQGGVYVSF